MTTSHWSRLDRDICQDTRLWLQGRNTHTYWLTYTLVLRGSALRWWKESITSYSTIWEPEPHPFWHKDTCTHTHTHIHTLPLFLFHLLSHSLCVLRGKEFLYDVCNDPLDEPLRLPYLPLSHKAVDSPDREPAFTAGLLAALIKKPGSATSSSPPESKPHMQPSFKPLLLYLHCTAIVNTGSLSPQEMPEGTSETD